MTQVGSSCADFICHIHVDFHTCFMSNSGQMQHGVGGTAQCHIYSQSIHKCIFCHNISGTDISSVQFHNLHTSMFCQFDTLGIYCGNGTIASQTHTDCFGQTVHGVCSVHTGTGTAGRTCFIFKFCYIIFGHSSCCIRANRFEHGGKTSLFTLYMASQHGTAAYKNSGNIHSCGCHQQTGNIFITVGNHNQRIKLMCQRHTFGGICDQISGNQRVFHTNMTHGNTVTYCNSGKHNGGTSCHSYAQLYSLSNLIQIHVTGNNFIIGTNNTNQGFFQFLFCHTKCIK